VTSKGASGAIVRKDRYDCRIVLPKETTPSIADASVKCDIGKLRRRPPPDAYIILVGKFSKLRHYKKTQKTSSTQTNCTFSVAEAMAPGQENCPESTLAGE
ncbi:MAG: hypothetical protein ABSC42_15720, partial [Tepidisphaeraceae bacterium]